MKDGLEGPHGTGDAGSGYLSGPRVVGFGIGTEMISSAADVKEAGWRSLENNLQRLIETDRGAAEELMTIHRFITEGTPDTVTDEIVRADMTLDLLSLDRPDGSLVLQNKQDQIIRLVEQAKAENRGVLWFQQKVREAVAEECLKNTTISLDPRLRGQLRSFGTRKIEGYAEELVYASHVNVIASTEMQWATALTLSLGHEVFPPRSYYGLSVGLGDVYKRFCAAYDAMPHDKLDDKLGRESFFQIIGTRILHPCWDANGRAFAGFLMKSLHRYGYQVTREQIQGMIPVLSKLNDTAMEKILTHSKLASVTGEWHFNLRVNPDVRADYMERLKKGTEDAIDAGTSSGSPFFGEIEQAKEAIRSLV